MTLGTSDSLTETLARFRTDLRLYARACLSIRTKQAQIVPLEPNFAQRTTQDRLTAQLRETGRIRAVVLKARQEGVSTWVAARFFRAIHLWPGTVAMIVADSLDHAENIFSIYERFYNNLPPEITPSRISKQRGRYLKFKTDSELAVRPSADTEAGRSYTIHRLHASELAFWNRGPNQSARETWLSLMQAVPPDSGEIIVESTAKGAGGLFHDLWQQATRGESGWVAIFLPWWIHEEYELDAPPALREAIESDPDEFEKAALGPGIPWEGENHVLPISKLAWRRAVIAEKFGGDPLKPLLEDVRGFQQEYPATAEEAFLISGACFFDEFKLREMSHNAAAASSRGRLYSEETVVDGVKKQRLRFEGNIRGNLRLYEDPVLGAHYVIGADTATGEIRGERRANDEGGIEQEDRDDSAAIVLRLGYKDTEGVFHVPKVVAELHGKMPPEVFAQQLNLLGRFYSCGGGADKTVRSKALVAVERNHSSGQTVIQLLHEHYRYNPLYWQRKMNVLKRTTGQRVGWITDGLTRPLMLDYLAQLVREDGIEIPSPDLIGEMMTFITWDDGKPAAQEGTHDDRVMALAIACQMEKSEHRHAYAGKMPETEIEHSLVK